MTDKEIDPLKDYKGFFEEFQNENPRGAVILAGAFFDAQLRELLSKFFVDEKKEVDELLGSEEKPDRPLSSFGARIRAAYCLGLISRMEYDDLKMIQKIRNKFAHKMHGYSFNDPKIVSWCQELKLARMIGNIDSSTYKLPTSHENLFVISVTMLAMWLAMKTLRVENDRRSVPADQKIGKLVR